MSLLECHRSYVRPGDCDEMGHMNVQHYAAKFDDAAAVLLAQAGVPPQARVSDHFRFHRELRASERLVVTGGCTAQEGGRATLMLLMREPLDDALAATALVTVALAAANGPLPRAELAREAAPRALAGAARLPNRAEAAIPPFRTSHLARVAPAECGPEGRLAPSHVMARLSDAQGELWAMLGIPRSAQAARGLGTATLEYRIGYGALPPAGAVVRLLTGLSALSEKTVQFRHWLFADGWAEAVAAADGVAVLFDRATRRAIPLPDDVRAATAAHGAGA